MLTLHRQSLKVTAHALAFGTILSSTLLPATITTTLAKSQSEAIENIKDPPVDENPYMLDAQVYGQSLSKYAKKINEPAECFGEDFITFEQLTSPEWQLCATQEENENEDEDGGEDEKEDEKEEFTYMCTTDSPSRILRHLVVNDVQEDSFAIAYRRKSKEVPTNVFLNEKDTEMYNKFCPIDKNYVQADSRCTGSYRQGAFQFYPPFVIKGCQC